MITYDRPGYGESDPRPGRRVVDAAGDGAAIAAHLGIERFAVVGTSGGGPHALACSARLGARVSRVGIVVGAAPSDDPEFDFLAGMDQLNLDEFSAAAESEEALAAFLEPFVEEARRDPDALLDEIVKHLPAPDQEVFQRPEERAIGRESIAESVRQGSRGGSTTTARSQRAGASRSPTPPARRGSGRASSTCSSRARTAPIS